jgi:hypothetical protein
MFRAVAILANVDELNNSLGKYAPLANLSVLAFVLILGAVFLWAFWNFVRKWLPTMLENQNTQMTQMRESYEERTDKLMEESWLRDKEARDHFERMSIRRDEHCDSERKLMRDAIHAMRNQASVIQSMNQQQQHQGRTS